MADRERPVFNFICDERSWSDLLGMVKAPHRFSLPGKIDQELQSRHGRPLFLRGDGFDFHVYPPAHHEPPAARPFYPQED